MTKSPILAIGPKVSSNILQSKNFTLKYPMILMTDKLTPPSRIDEPLYILDNETLYEKYYFKGRSGSLDKNVILGSIMNNIFRWDDFVINKNLLDRRGNFNNITIFGMSSRELNQVRIPRNLKSIRNVSAEFPDTIEVSQTFQCKCNTVRPWRGLTLMNWQPDWKCAK